MGVGGEVVNKPAFKGHNGPVTTESAQGTGSSPDVSSFVADMCRVV